MVTVTERDIDDLTDVYINKVIYPDGDDDGEMAADNGECGDRRKMIEMPKSIYVTKVPTQVFHCENMKAEFERLFPDHIAFAYFPNFARVRVEFTTSLNACRARIKFHLYEFDNAKLRVFLTNHVHSDEQLNDDDTGRDLLKPPKLEKQFLISPPASPPEGWAPIREDGPCREQPGLHFELVARLAALAEGQSHEIIEPSPMAPAIVLHACEDPKDNTHKNKLPFEQTRRPNFN